MISSSSLVREAWPHMGVSGPPVCLRLGSLDGEPRLSSFVSDLLRKRQICKAVKKEGAGKGRR